jgi:aldehyde dehydrogenase (NAD+)
MFHLVVEKNSSFGPREQGSYAKELYTQVKTSYISGGNL